MHHCVATYADQVQGGSCYVYSVTKAGQSVATLALERYSGNLQLGQVRGPCNSLPAAAATKAVRRWLAQARRTPRRAWKEDKAA